jgi:hypothetical protein
MISTASNSTLVLVHALAIAQALRSAASPYLRGDGAAAEYLGYEDPQGRKFREWAVANRVPFSEVGTVRTYRKRDLDKAWARKAVHLNAWEAEGAL